MRSSEYREAGRGNSGRGAWRGGNHVHQGRGAAPGGRHVYGDGGRNPQGRGIYQSQGTTQNLHGALPTRYQGRGSQPQGTSFRQLGRPMLEGNSDEGGIMTPRPSWGRSSGPSRSPPTPHQASGVLNQSVLGPDGYSSQNTSSKTPQPIPFSIVNQVQDLTLQSEGSTRTNISLRYPPRPGKGTVGRNCLLKANHFKVELQHDELYHYDISITPEVTSRLVNCAIVKKLVAMHKASDLGKQNPAYDGRKSLYTARPLPFTSKKFSITLFDEDDGKSLPRREREFQVVIKLAARVDLQHLSLFMQGKQSEIPQQALNVLDIVLRQQPTSRYVSLGRSFYSPEFGRKQSLGEGLESCGGFYQSVRPTQMGLSLNIDMTATAFLEPLQVIDFVTQLLDRKAIPTTLSDDDCVKVKRALRGVKVEVTHRGEMRRKYRVSGVTALATRDLTFLVDQTGTMKYVTHYFQETYGCVLKHTAWPCLEVGSPQRPNYLPMEVCKIVEGQRFSRKLNQKQKNALLKASCQHPRDREKEILRIVVEDNTYHDDDCSKEFGIKINDEFASVEARILPPPRLQYGGENIWLPQGGQWNMMDKTMVDGGTVRTWTCIDFANTKEGVIKRFCSELALVCSALGMAFNREPVLRPFKADPNRVEESLKACHHDCRQKLQHSNRELDLLICILPDKRVSRYGELKRICDTDLGIVSQCCLLENIIKMNRQCMTNLALKINVKVGGRNTMLVDALSRNIPLLGDQPTIIFGADVSHPHPGEDSSPSIAAVVASQDWPEVTKYASLVSTQNHRDEIIRNMKNMVEELLRSFESKTGCMPQRIIFYRDGVSEGQFYEVLSSELNAIRRACTSIKLNYRPPVTFVVVQKRHHTRLFADNYANRSAVDVSGNVLPGTVVDSRICHPTEFDFYLCSHAGLKGTSRPAHYHVLCDENKFTADGLQTLTYMLCYTYARCTRSVSIVTPAYYAHWAAFRARFYLGPERLDDRAPRGRGGVRNTRDPGTNAVRALPGVKEKVRAGMYFC